MPDRVDLVLGTSLGGVGRHVHSLVVALVRRNAQVWVHGPAATDETFGFAAAGARFEPVDIRAGVAPVHALLAARQLRHRLHHAGLVHAHGVRAGLVAATAVRRMRRPDRPRLLVTWHNVPSDAPRAQWLQRRLEARLARAGDINLAVSADLVERVRAFGGRDVRLQPVGSAPLPPPLRSRDAVRAALRADDRPIVLGIGRLHRQKGFDVLLEAARTWGNRPAQPLLVIAGDGPDRDALHGEATRHLLDVRWLGYVADRTTVSELLHTADLVVVPSRWEGSPLAVHEALSAGRPVIATAVGGLPTLLQPDDVLFVPPDDPAALAAAIVQLLDHPDDAAARAAAGQHAASRWPDESAAAEAVIQTYAEVAQLSP